MVPETAATNCKGIECGFPEEHPMLTALVHDA